MKTKNPIPHNYVVSITDTALNRKVVVSFFCQTTHPLSGLGYMIGVTKSLKGLLGTRWGILVHQMDRVGHKDILYKTMIKTIDSIRAKLRDLNIYGTAACDKIAASEKVINLPANTPTYRPIRKKQ